MEPKNITAAKLIEGWLKEPGDYDEKVGKALAHVDWLEGEIQVLEAQKESLHRQLDDAEEKINLLTEELYRRDFT